MAARSTLIRLHNRSAHTLTKQSAGLDHGQWTNPNEPPGTIPPGATIFIESESDGVATGTEGSFSYTSNGGGSLTFHWDNPFAGVNSYSQGPPAGCGLCFSGGKGDNAELDLQLVPSERVALRNFEPSANAFIFSNDGWPSEALVRIIKMPDPFGDITIGNADNGICGGMALATADYFLAGRLAPSQTVQPAGIGDPLYDYIVGRLIDSWNLPGGPLTYWKYQDPAYPNTPRIDADGRSWVLAHEGFPAVMAAIDAGRPCALGLVMIKSLLPTDLGHNHQVLAYAYQLVGGKATVWVYDPNSPGRDDITIAFDLSDASNEIAVTHNVNAKRPIYTFFSTDYTASQPPQEPPPEALDVFYIGGDRAVATTWANPAVQAGKWQDPFPITSPAAAGNGTALAVITRFRGALDAFWFGADNSVSTNWANPAVDNATWHTPFAIAPAGAARGDSGLAVITRFVGALDAFWVMPNGAIATNWANPEIDGAKWHDAFTITPPNAARSGSPVAAITRLQGALDVFWIGTDGAIATNWANPQINNGAWHSPFPIAPPGAARSDSGLAVITRLNGALDVFWIGPDGALATTWANPAVDSGNWHTPFPITPPGAARAGSPVAALTRLQGALDVYYIGPDGAVATVWANPQIDSSKWQPPFPIASPNAARIDSRLCAVTRGNGAVDVFWTGFDGALATNWANPQVDSAKWHAAFPITKPAVTSAASSMAVITRH